MSPRPIKAQHPAMRDDIVEGSLSHSDTVAASRNVFLYVVRGELQINAQPVQPHRLIELDNRGEQIDMTAQSDAMILFGHAEPLGEPVVAHGPFVMNTREEIMEAIRDYQAGKFEAEAEQRE